MPAFHYLIPGNERRGDWEKGRLGEGVTGGLGEGGTGRRCDCEMGREN